jgi:hypothetical protein
VAGHVAPGVLRRGGLRVPVGEIGESQQAGGSGARVMVGSQTSAVASPSDTQGRSLHALRQRLPRR